MGNICSACERDKEYFQIKETSTKQPRTIAVTTLIEKERRHYTETIERRTSSKRLDILAESFKEEKPLPVNTSMTQQEFLKRTLKNMKKLNASLRPSTSYLIKGEVAIRALTGDQSYSQDSCYYEVDRGKLNKAAIKIQRWFLQKKGFRKRGIVNTTRQISAESKQTEESMCFSFPASYS